MKELMENILPYLNVTPQYNEKELEIEENKQIIVPNLINMTVSDAKKLLDEQKINYEIDGTGDIVRTQFPPSEEVINYNGKVIIYTN